MDEDELRLLGAEKAVMALAAWRDPASVMRALTALREELATCEDDDEKVATKQAIQLIQDGRGHHHPFTRGLRMLREQKGARRPEK